MTGHQDNPSTGRNAKGETAPAINIEALVRACGVEHIDVCDPFDLKEFTRIVKEATEREELSVIISRRPCALIVKQPEIPYEIGADLSLIHILTGLEGTPGFAPGREQPNQAEKDRSGFVLAG